MVLAGLSLSTIAIVGLTFVDEPTTYIVGVLLLGFALFAVRPVIQSWMMNIVPDGMRGSATSL